MYQLKADTLHRVLMYQLPGSDATVAWTPPTALRKFDVIFVEEFSQYTGTEAPQAEFKGGIAKQNPKAELLSRIQKQSLQS